MSELETIRTVLEGAARRHRLARAVRGGCQGLLAGGILSLIVLAINHLIPLPLWITPVAALLPIAFILAGMMIAAWTRTDLAVVARWADQRQHLRERLSTALEISDGADETPWRGLVLSDAAQHAKSIDTRRLLPFHLPKVSRWALVVLVLAAGLGFVPEYRSKRFRQKQTDNQNIQETGRLLTELTHHTLEKRPPAFEPTQKSLEAVSSLGEQLAKQTLTRSDALKDLANVAEKLKDELKELGKDPGLKRMEEAARSNGGSDAQTATGLQKQIDSLQKQLGTPTGTPDALEKLQKNLEKLQQAAKGLADKNSAGTDAERQKLSDSLSALSKQMQALGMQLPQLDDAINALAANQTDLFLKDLDAATTDLEKMREMAKTLQQLQQQMEKLGKDLAEQLQNGQPEVAQQSLQKMITQLNSANLKPEQLAKDPG